jgi:pentatricopeptide repeat protein
MLFCRPTRKSYNILLDAFAISGLVDEANTVFKAMRRHRYNPHHCIYLSAINWTVDFSHYTLFAVAGLSLIFALIQLWS